MPKHHELKNEARRAEQRSDWARAIELYKSAIRLEESSGSGSDVGVYNRIGDLHLRQGDTASAVEYYEEAAERYAAHGLHTSAIALCNKILRIAPNRDEVYGRLARLHASTGLLAEARGAFLRFAERMRETDRLSEAMEAVQDLVSLTGDEDLRTAFADQLTGAGLTAQAVAQLRLVYQARIAGGRSGQDIREKIVDLDPDADPVAAAPAPPPRATRTQEPLVSHGAFPGLEPETDSGPLAAPPPVPEPREIDLGALEILADPPPPDQNAGTGDWEPLEPPAGSDLSLESVLTRFRSHVLEIVEETDHAVHYDLGVAYMGMDLFEDAMREFRMAMQSPSLVESAHALLGECIKARGAAGIEEPPAAERPSADGPLLPLASSDDFMLGQSLDLGVPRQTDLEQPAARPPETPGSLVPSAASDPEAETAQPATSDEQELADMLFQARLAQHRARAASEEGRADHEAHLDLGRTYERMGLLAEAVRDLTAATGGPAGVQEQALDGLARIAEAEGIDGASLRDAMDCLMEHGRDDVAIRAGRDFTRRPGIREAERQQVLAVLPPEAAGEPDPGTVDGSGQPVRRALDDLGDILAVLEGHGDGEPPEDGGGAPAWGASTAEGGAAVPLLEGEDADALFGEAEGLRAAGRMDEAESHYYRALELYEKDRDAINAIRAVDRLLSLRPDDVVLHHQKNEFAIMTNDRELLISSYLDLAACLRRQNGFRSARTVYGRILDLDPQNAEARAGVAAVDADELARERQRQQRSGQRSTGAPAAGREQETERAGKPAPVEFDAMFGDLREEGGTAEDESEPDYESHFELGVAFRQMEMWDEAAREFKQASQGLSEPLEAFARLGECLVALRRYDEAKRTLAVAITQPGQEVARAGVLFQLGVAHLRSGDPATARSCLERVLKIDPSRTDASRLLSTLPA